MLHLTSCSFNDSNGNNVYQDLLGPLPHSDASGAGAPRVCHVLVVDDGTSSEERSVMLSSFPQFTYYFKGPGDVKGDPPAVSRAEGGSPWHVGLKNPLHEQGGGGGGTGIDQKQC